MLQSTLEPPKLNIFHSTLNNGRTQFTNNFTKTKQHTICLTCPLYIYLAYTGIHFLKVCTLNTVSLTILP